MGRRRSDIDRDLQALYEQVPDVGCRGLCHEACGPIGMSRREETRLRETSGVRIPSRQEVLASIPEGGYTCPVLAGGRCTAYEVRPMICRVYGASEDMPCPHGCRPVDGGPLLTTGQTVGLVAASKRVGGANGHVAPPAALRRLLDAEDAGPLRAAVRAYIGGPLQRGDAAGSSRGVARR